MSTLPNVGKVRLSRRRDKFFVTFFRLGSGILPILVIAFTVKGAFAFEGKSDNLRLELRQTERQEKLIDAFRKHLKIADGIESEVIIPAVKTETKGIEELYDLMKKALSEWEDKNKDKSVFFTLNIGESLTIPRKVNFDGIPFRPAGMIVFYISKKVK